jgi:hypothetical protein
VKGPGSPRCGGVIREGWETATDGDAAGLDDRRAVGELGFVAGGRGVTATPVGSLLEMVRTSAGVGMMPAP